MQVVVAKAFERDIKRHLGKQVREAVLNTIVALELAPNLQSLTHIKKLQGHKHYYRIALHVQGVSYRLGIKVVENEVTLLRFLSRQDFYNYFPPE